MARKAFGVFVLFVFGCGLAFAQIPDDSDIAIGALGKDVYSVN